MGIAQYDPVSLGLPAWNAGRTVGVKKPLKQKYICRSVSSLTREGGFEIGRCSILQSTASQAEVLSEQVQRFKLQSSGGHSVGFSQRRAV